MEMKQHKPFMLYVIGWSEYEDELQPRLLSFIVNREDSPDTTSKRITEILEQEELHPSNFMVLPEPDLFQLTQLLVYARKELTERPDDATLQ
jgi:hypothetical protein